jgi:hypothetical protein
LKEIRSNNALLNPRISVEVKTCRLVGMGSVEASRVTLAHLKLLIKMAVQGMVDESPNSTMIPDLSTVA